jgi:hypothetical protein
VVRSAARRRLAVVTIEQLAFACAPVLGGLVLLLLLGTQILSWYWLALLAAVAGVLAFVRIRARNVSTYQAAQILDNRLNLEDSLSTAWYLLEHANGHADPIARFQLRHSENIATQIQPASAFPLSFGRAWALTGALATLAFALFAVRYLVTSSLSLQQSLIPVSITPVLERLEARLPTRGKPAADLVADRALSSGDKTQGELPDPDNKNSQLQGDAARSANDPSGTAESKQAQSGKPGEGQNTTQQSDPNSAESQADGKQPDQNAESQKAAQAGDPKQQSNRGQQGGQGLMDRMKDAVNSLMAKMRQGSSPQTEQSERQSDESKPAGQNSVKAQAGQHDARNQQAGQDQTADGQNQAQASERTQGSQGRSSDATPEKGADAHSGIGRQDGDKSLKEAEQLQAMGKLAEIIGKRSANVTGDMTVETPSSKQQLKTEYTQRVGPHSDSGGEINRDEVPLADQRYVRQYMELIRKQPKATRP